MQGKDICVGLWDTAGSERYEAMSHMYYRDAKAAVICYDITDAGRCVVEKRNYTVESHLMSNSVVIIHTTAFY